MIMTQLYFGYKHYLYLQLINFVCLLSSNESKKLAVLLFSSISLKLILKLNQQYIALNKLYV